jgi:hypothetical protein
VERCLLFAPPQGGAASPHVRGPTVARHGGVESRDRGVRGTRALAPAPAVPRAPRPQPRGSCTAAMPEPQAPSHGLTGRSALPIPGTAPRLVRDARGAAGRRAPREGDAQPQRIVVGVGDRQIEPLAEPAVAVERRGGIDADGEGAAQRKRRLERAVQPQSRPSKPRTRAYAPCQSCTSNGVPIGMMPGRSQRKPGGPLRIHASCTTTSAA